jgi:FMN phosphatase YigB (HAD superfamily)
MGPVLTRLAAGIATMKTDLSHVRCVVFDYGFTLSSGLYFNVSPPEVAQWPELVQRVVFGRREIIEPWMRGEISLEDIAGILAYETGMERKEILGYLRRGCTDLGFNPAVHAFARWVRSTSLRSALVTANMDVFSDVVVESHGLERWFDVIVNSADVGTCDKTILWSLAFESLGSGLSYHNALLVEDGEENPAEFRNQGGAAYQYSGEDEFRQWLRDVDFGANGRPLGR